MSSPRTWRRMSSTAPLGSAPGCWNTITWSRKIISVGIERIPKWPASAPSSSVLTLTKATSGLSAATDSKIGAKALHGPHQGAQKSTTTMS